MDPAPFDDFDAVVIDLPAIVKSRWSPDGQRRLVEVEASCEIVDNEGDVIFQRALFDDAANFLAVGLLDIDHIFEFGPRLRIPDYESYVVGRPVDVRDLGNGRTSVIGELFRSSSAAPVPPPAVLDWQRRLPCTNRHDALWHDLQTESTAWYASIYGFPRRGMVRECTYGACASGATNLEIYGIHWKSMAFTRMPQNMNLTGKARVVLAKSRLGHMTAMLPSLTGSAAPGTRRNPVVVTDPAHMELAGQQAAPPTSRQAVAHNYAHGHAVVGGLDVTIETPMGRMRYGTGADGASWAVRMPVDYGYVKGTRDADGDQVDVYLGPAAHRAERHPVWVIDQIHKDGTWNEHKCLVGFHDQEQARRAYYASFSDGKGPERVGAVSELSFSAFRDWLENGDHMHPFSYVPPREAAKAPLVPPVGATISASEDSPAFLLPDSMETLWTLRECPGCEVHKAPSLLGYRHHFATCKGATPGQADLCAHALMHRYNMDEAGKGWAWPAQL